MSQLPTPPDAYWAQIPWWAYIGFLTVSLVIMVVISPWFIQRARNQPSAILSREQSLKLREDAYQLRQERDLVALSLDRDRGWNIARGWNAVAHQLWHDLNNATLRYNTLLTLCRRVGDGHLAADALRDRVADMKTLPAAKPLPAIEIVEQKKPGETEYA